MLFASVSNNVRYASGCDHLRHKSELTRRANFYKVEKRTRDGTKVKRLLYAGNNLDKAHKIFAAAPGPFSFIFR
jgi:hypothetical protein